MNSGCIGNQKEKKYNGQVDIPKTYTIDLILNCITYYKSYLPGTHYIKVDQKTQTVFFFCPLSKTTLGLLINLTAFVVHKSTLFLSHKWQKV